MTQPNRTDTTNLAEAGERLYEGKLRNKLEPRYSGQIVAIEVESGDYFLGSTLHEANQKAQRKYPDKVFYAVKVGHPAVYSFASRVPISTST